MLEPGDHAQRGGLARAGRAEKSEKLAIRDVQAQPVQADRPVGKHAAQSIEADGGHQPFTAPAPNPRVRCFCKTPKQIRTGTDISTEAAISSAHSTF